MVGSENERKARDYCKKKLRDLGFRVESETFPVSCFVEKESSLKMLEPQSSQIPSRAFGRSISTPGDGIDGKIEYISKIGDFAEKDLKGKFVLTDAPAFTTVAAPSGGILLAEANKYGAIALIMASGTPGNVIFSNPGPRFGTTIPAVNISQEEGDRIKAYLEKGPVKLWCRIDSSMERGSSENMTAVLKGKTKPNELIYVTAHVDSVYTTAGANDNASGVAVVLELARLLRKKRYRRSVCLAIFSGEEGAGGSDDYVSKHKDVLPNIKALLNFDMCARGPKITTDVESFYFTSDDVSNPGKTVRPPKWLVKLIHETGAGMGYKIERSKFYGTGDEGVFLYNGVPSVFWGRSGGVDGISWNEAFPHYHNELDTLERCDINGLKSIVDIAMVVVEKLANAVVLPRGLDCS